MELSKEFMKEFVELQLCARVEKVEYDANLPLRDVEDEILRNTEISEFNNFRNNATMLSF